MTRLLALAVIAIASVGCGPGDASTPCLTNDDCATPDVCVVGRCVVPPDAHRVDAGADAAELEDAAVTADAGSDAAVDDASPIGCVPECEPTECRASECLDGICVGMDAAEGTKCSSGRCLEGECRPEGSCASDAHCDDGVVCTRDSCLLGLCMHAPEDLDGDGHIGTECGGGDCDDGDPEVNPDVTEFHTTPIAGPGSGFDYDCSGEEDFDFPTTTSCGGLPPCASDGYSSAARLVCGAPATFTDCIPDLISCRAATSMRIVACR